MTLFAQDFPKLHYKVEDGLPSNTVYNVYRDSKGFLWFTTDKGVARYNGIRFETFSTFNGLADNEVFFTVEDPYGRIWFGTYNGELCYYKDGEFHTAANTPFLRLKDQSSFIKKIYVEKDSSVTIWFFEEKYFLNIDKEAVKVYKTDQLKGFNLVVSDSSIPYTVMSVNKISDARYQVVRRHDIIDLDVRNGSLKVENKDYYIVNNMFSHAQKFYICKTQLRDAALNIIGHFSNSIISRLNNGQLEINSVYRNGEYTLISTNKGVFVNRLNAAVLSDSVIILPNISVSSIEQDVNGNYWATTLGNGIYNFDKDFHVNRQFDGVYNGAVKYSCVANGNIFFVTDSANLFQFQSGITRPLFNYKKYRRIEKLNVPGEPGFFINDRNRFFCFFNNENVVVRNVFEKGNTEVYPSVYANNNFKTILPKGENSIYVLNLRRLFYLDYDHLWTGTDICHQAYFILHEVNNRARVFCANLDRDARLWYSTINGVYKVVSDTPVLQPQFKQIVFKQFLFLDKYMVGFTHTNKLLVCSDYDGAMRVVEVPEQQCIWEKFYKVDDTSVLISSNNYYRYLKIHPGRQPLFSIVTVENDQIPIKPESVCSDLRCCYFFVKGGVTAIAIDYLKKQTAPPTLRFTSLKTAQKTYPMGGASSLSYGEARNIKIHFSTISFASKNISYQYSISKNIEDSWSDIQGEEINMVDPSWGNYTVKIRARTMSGVMSNPVSFRLAILKPFGAQWWFLGIVVCCAGFIILLVVRRRIAAIVKARESAHDNKVRFMKSEYKALNALMNPHFIFNTLNNVQSLVNKDDKRAANEYLRIFADLVRQNMHNVSNELIPLEKEMTLVRNYLLLEKLRFKEYLHYEVDIDNDVDLSEIMVPPLLIQPLVENSIKHGIYPLESVEGIVKVHVFERNNVLHLEIRDNGVGLSAVKKTNGEHTSFGLDNISKRLEQLSIIQNRRISFEITEIVENERKWTVGRILMDL